MKIESSKKVSALFGKLAIAVYEPTGIRIVVICIHGDQLKLTIDSEDGEAKPSMIGKIYTIIGK